jgi:hypothetical protein
MRSQEVHDESLPRANFFMSYVMLLAASGARSFSLHDIYKPEPKSLIQNLSFVINFARFRNERLEHVNELTTELVRHCFVFLCPDPSRNVMVAGFRNRNNKKRKQHDWRCRPSRRTLRS